MARRCITILLMMAYFASQLAMVPHAHGASDKNEPSDHDARPHIHTSWLKHVGHSHDDGYTHHHECDGSHSHPVSSDANTRHENHDSDAVYLPNDSGVSVPSKSVVLLDSPQFFSTLAIVALTSPMTISACSADAYAPDKCSLGCPLYLALRALRI